MKKSYNIEIKVNNDTNPQTRKKYDDEFTINVNNIAEYKWDETDEEFISKLPSDKYGVYVVYSDEQCIYVGETAMNGGFQNRFKKHHYLQEFLTEARRVVLYEINKELSNERILLEKIKIKQLNPILNRAEEKEQSLKFSNDVANRIRELTDDLLKVFDYYADKIKNPEKIQEIDNRVGKKFRQVYNLLQTVRLPILPAENSVSLSENGVIPTVILPNVIYCPQCSGEPCEVCNSTNKLIITDNSPCKICSGKGFINNDYCSECKGTMVKDFKPFNEDEFKDRRWRVCSPCYGTGETVNEETCPDCNGKRFIYQ
ncbi:hypothetical protein ACQJ0K_14610 [Priestia megaterium]|uniref:GIY-YIG nuclease family protein n=1 Tax=Priestia megaterium TaxID=1404 RepID=UPI003CF45708